MMNRNTAKQDPQTVLFCTILRILSVMIHGLSAGAIRLSIQVAADRRCIILLLDLDHNGAVRHGFL